ncbi:unnamed protein product [Urochloa humidicola]
MGIPLEPCRGADTLPAAPPCRQRPCGVAGKEPAAAATIGCRTPPRREQQEGGDDDVDAARVLVCPPAPRKKRSRAAPAAGAQRKTTEFYTGADLEAFFAAHNL